MKVLSFDVGIKNLAYCLIDDTQDTIEDWGILNISADPVCGHQMKGRCCDKTAKFTVEGVNLCPSHRNLKKYKDCKAKKIPKLKNPLLPIGKNIVRLLDSKPKFLEVDAVIIENQPALKNPTMKSVQMIVYSYFLVKGITVDSPMETIELINARNKLKAYTGPPISCEIKDKYKRTKFLGIQYCDKMIQENTQIREVYRELFHASRKKDDLADAYLQGMYWLGTRKKSQTTK
jgi:hypothetical protein